MKANFTRWSSMNMMAEEAYQEIYGEQGCDYISILETAPYEIAVISQLMTHLQKLTLQKQE